MWPLGRPAAAGGDGGSGQSVRLWGISLALVVLFSTGLPTGWPTGRPEHVTVSLDLGLDLKVNCYMFSWYLCSLSAYAMQENIHWAVFILQL